MQARAQADDEQLEASRDTYARSAELNAASPVVHFEHGQVLAKLEEVDAAVAAFDRAAALEDVDGRSAFAAAETLHSAGRVDEAVERLREMVIAYPFHGTAALLLVKIARDQGRLEEDESYVLARQANRYHMHAGPEAHLEFGALALGRDEFENASEAYGLAVAKAYDVPNARYGRARALAGLNRNAEAIADLEAVLASEEFSAPVEASALLETLRAKVGEGQS